MDYSVLGRTGIRVSRLGLGGLWLTGGAQGAGPIVRAAVAGGINYIDTAPAYGDSENVLGQALKGVEAPLVLSTKLGGRPLPFDPRSADDLVCSAHESLRRLGRTRIDLLLIHEPDRTRQYDWWSEPLTYDGPVWEAIARLRSEEVIGAVGIGGTTVTELARLCASGKFDVVLTAFNFSLLWREAQTDVVPVAREHGMGVICGSPLQGGVLARRRDAQVRDGAPWLSEARRAQLLALGQLCDQTGLDLVQMALRFVYHSDSADCVLTGAGSVAELDASLAAVAAGPLPPDVLNALSDIHALLPRRPALEPFILPLGNEAPGQPALY